MSHTPLSNSENAISSMNRLERYIDKFLQENEVLLEKAKEKAPGKFQRNEIRYLSSLHIYFFFEATLWWAPTDRGSLAPYYMISIGFARIPERPDAQLYEGLLTLNFTELTSFRYCILKKKYLGIIASGRVDQADENYWRDLFKSLEPKWNYLMQIQQRFKLKPILTEGRTLHKAK